MNDPVRQAELRASALAADGRGDEALKAILEVLGTGRGTATAHQLAAELLVKAGRGTEAATHYQSACESFARAGKFFRALAMCKVLLRLQPDNTAAQDQLAALYGATRGFVSHRSTLANLEGPTAAARAAASRDSGLTPSPSTEPFTRGTPLPFDPQGPLPVIPLFSELSADEFKAVLSGAVELRAFRAGEAIVTEGETGDSMFAVCHGEVSVERPEGNGVHEIARMKEGDTFGEMGLFLGGRRLATVKTKTDVTAIEFSRSAMDAVLRKHPGVGRALDRFFRERLLSNLLRASPLFQPLAAQTKSELAWAFEPKSYEAGAILVRHGTSSDGLYVVLRGHCEVLDASGQRYADLYEGAHFGEISLMLGKAATATLRTGGAVTVLKLPAEVFREKVLTNPTVKANLMREARERLERTSEVLMRGLNPEWV